MERALKNYGNVMWKLRNSCSLRTAIFISFLKNPVQLELDSLCDALTWCYIRRTFHAYLRLFEYLSEQFSLRTIDKRGASIRHPTDSKKRRNPLREKCRCSFRVLTILFDRVRTLVRKKISGSVCFLACE